MSNCNFCKYAQKKIDELGVKLHKADSIWQAQEERIDELEAQLAEALVFLNCVKNHKWPELDSFLRSLEEKEGE